MLCTVSSGTQPPRSISNLLGSKLRNYSVKLKKQMLVDASTVCWAIWLSRNGEPSLTRICRSILGGLTGRDVGPSCLKRKRRNH
jgi:hypothetical protein